MKKLFLYLPLLFVFACNSDTDKEKEEVIELKTSKDRLSYALGSMSAQSLVGSKDENMKKLDIDELIEGFGENLKDNEPKECEETIQKLFGPYFQDFDTAFAKAGSKCIGRLTAYSLYKNIEKTGALSELDFDMVKNGFKYAMLQKDTLMTEQERTTIVQNFLFDINVKNGDKMISDAKNLPNAQVFENGIVMVTLKEGTGGSPAATDDVEVEYILTSATGDTIQSSYDMKKQRGSTDPVALSLDGGVIPAWSYALPKMKKGGKYQLYVPWDQAYGEQGGKESLSFTIDLVNYGKKGTLVKPVPPQQGMPQGF